MSYKLGDKVVLTHRALGVKEVTIVSYDEQADVVVYSYPSGNGQMTTGTSHISQVEIEAVEGAEEFDQLLLPFGDEDAEEEGDAE